MSGTTAYTFGPYRVLPARRLLLRGGHALPITAKAFDTLIALIERRDRVVTKDELMQLLWGDVAVEESNLTQQIFLLRKTLGDSPDGEKYIATIARHGYRFSGDVEELSERDGAGRARRRTAFSAAALLVAVAAIALAGWLALRSRSGAIAPLPVAATIEPPEGLALSNSIALSPDGGALVFTASRPDGSGGLWIRSIGELESRPLPGTEGALYPFWSPDSRWIAFFAGNELKRISPAGGPAQVLAPAVAGLGGSWSQLGQIVFAATGLRGLSCVSAEGGSPVDCTGLDPARLETGHRWPQFLSDGRHVVFMVRSNRPVGRLTIAVAKIGDPPAHHRTLEQADTGGILVDDMLLYVRGRVLWARPFDQQRLEFNGPAVPVIEDVWRSWGWEGLHGCTAARERLIACRRGGADTRMIWVDRDGRELGAAAPSGAVNPELSPDGTRLLFGRITEGTADTMWVANRDGSKPARLTRVGMNVETHAWSPDGMHVVFASEQSGHFELYELSLAEPEHEHPVLTNANFKMVFDWSRDGRWLLYRETTAQLLYDVRALRMDTMPQPQPVVNVVRSAGDENYPRFSPDGLWVAYTSKSAGQDDVFVHPFDRAGPTMPVSTDGGIAPRWRADGRELYFVSADRHLMAVDVTWTNGVPAFAEPRRLFDRYVAPSGYHYDYCPDKNGQQFLVNSVVTRGSITLLADWRNHPQR